MRHIFRFSRDIPHSSSFSLIAYGAIDLPLSRNAGGAAALEIANSATVSFANASAFTSFLIIFPTLRNEVTTNSMQVAEVQLGSSAGNVFGPQDQVLGVQAAGPIPVPEPAVGVLGVLGAVSLLRRRRN